jgi:hypothetical protein
MSDSPLGQGWWQASDGKWYPSTAASNDAVLSAMQAEYAALRVEIGRPLSVRVAAYFAQFSTARPLRPGDDDCRLPSAGVSSALTAAQIGRLLDHGREPVGQ